MAIRRLGLVVIVSVFALLALHAAPVAVADDGDAVVPRTSDDLGAPPKSVVLEDVSPGTVLWTRTIPDSTPPATGVASPDEFPASPAPPPLPPTGEFPAAFPEDEALPVEPPMDPPPTEPPPMEPPVFEEVPPPPPPAATAPVFVRQPAPAASDDCSLPCAQKRDDCCYSLDWCGNRYGLWEVTLEATYGLMNDPAGVLGEPIFGPGFPQYDWDELDYEFEFGGRAGIKYQFQAQSWFELRGAYYGKWEALSNQPVRRFGFLPTPPFVSGASNGILQSEAELYGIELNYINELSCTGCVRFDFLAGLRYVNFEETAIVNFAPNAGVGLFGPGNVTSLSENVYIAGQLGAAVHWDASDRFTLSATLKALLGNMSREANVTDANIFVGGPHASRTKEDEVTFGADLELGFRYRLTPRIAVTGGYNLLFLDNVLRANDAMDFTKSVSGAVQAQQELDQLIVHSFFLGLNFNF